MLRAVSLSRAGAPENPCFSVEEDRGEFAERAVPPCYLPSLSPFPSLEGLLQVQAWWELQAWETFVPGRRGVSSVFWGRSLQLPLALPAATLAPTGARLTGFHMICRCPFLLVGGEQSSSIRFGRI